MTDIGLALVVWRIAHMLAHERAPFAMLTKFRRKIGIKPNEHSQLIATNELGELFMCVWCLSVSVGWLVALAHYRSWDFIVYGLAYSAVSCLLEGMVNR
jgi:hypothetical protein